MSYSRPSKGSTPTFGYDRVEAVLLVHDDFVMDLASVAVLESDIDGLFWGDAEQKTVDKSWDRSALLSVETKNRPGPFVLPE